MVPGISHLRSTLGVVVSTALAALGLSACGGAPAASGVVHALGAENQYANVISQIGGRYVDVESIISNPNTDPHTFEVSTSVAQEVAGAQLVVQNGVGYDAFMSQLESASPSPSRRVITVQTLLGLAGDTKNPHLWYLPRTMPAVAARVERDLAAIDPAHAAYFARRLAAFRTSMVPVTAAIAAFRARFAGVAVAATEPVADYLLSALGLVDLTPFRFQADIMNGVDPSPEDIAYEQTLYAAHRVRLLCYNAQVASTVTESLWSLAQRDDVPEVAVYETMPTPGYDYQTWMEAEISAMTKALTAHVSTGRL